MSARDRSPDRRQLMQECATGREAYEDDLDYAVVERVYGLAPPRTTQRPRRRAHACLSSVEPQD